LTGPFQTLEPTRLAASVDLVLLATTDGTLRAYNSSLGLLGVAGSPADAGAARDLDARHGAGLAVSKNSVVRWDGDAGGWVTLGLPPDVVACHGGAVYQRLDSGVQRVAVCSSDGGVFRAHDVEPTQLANFLIMPGVPDPDSVVQVRPDEDGTLGRYLVRANPAVGVWFSPVFQSTAFSVSGSSFNAGEALVATSEQQAAVLAVRVANGIELYRRQGASPGLSSGTRVTNAYADLRGLGTFTVPSSTESAEIYVLQKTGTADVLTFRDFELPSNINDWFVIVDRPGRIVAYRLGEHIDRAFAAFLPPSTLLIVARCSTMGGNSLCRNASGASTFHELRPID
jgi:hypothetical protein